MRFRLLNLPLLMLGLSTFAHAQTFPSAPTAQTYVARFGNSVATAPQSSRLNLGAQFTLEAWVYREGPSVRGVIVGKNMATGADPFRAYILGISSDGERAEFAQSTGQAGTYRSVMSPSPLPLNQWIHVAGTLSNGVLRLFINGVQVATMNSPGTPPQPAAPMAVGNPVSSTGPAYQGFQGEIRQVRVWGRGLSASELAANAGKSLIGNEPDLLAWWPLDEGSGQTARDHGPYGLDLTLGTSAVFDQFDPFWGRTAIIDSGPYFSMEPYSYPASLTRPDEPLLIDADSDGDLDFLMFQTDRSTFPPVPAFALRNNGAGIFSDATTAILGADPVRIVIVTQFAVADFNGDGRNDIFIGDGGPDTFPYSGGQNRLLIQAADGTFHDETSTRIPAFTAFTHFVTAADIDKDGDIDIYLNVIGPDQLGPRLLINNGSGVFSTNTSRLPSEIVNKGKVFTSGLFIDIDNDGDPDLVLGIIGQGTYSDTGQQFPCTAASCTLRDTLLVNDGAGNFTTAPDAALPLRHGGSGWGTVSMSTADFDRDGFPDLLLATHDRYTTPWIELFLNNHDGTFRDATNQLPPQSWPVGDTINHVYERSFSVADFNGDGWPDFVTSTDSVPSSLYINTGDAHFEDASDILPITRTIAEDGFGEFRAGDLDLDGDQDILLAARRTHYFILRSVKTYNPGITSYSFNFPARGGVSTSTQDSLVLNVGYGSVQPNSGSSNLDGLSIFAFRQNNVLVTEAAVPASKAIYSGRIYAEVAGTANTGLALANPNAQAAVVSFFFTDSNGNNFGAGSTTIPAYGQMARFLTEAPFNGGNFGVGTLTFTASQPVAALALRGFTNERSEFLLTTFPVADLSATASTANLVFSHFAAGGGWTTDIALFNPSDNAIQGTIQFVGPAGTPVSVRVDTQTASSFSYTLPARSSRRFQSSGDTATLSGSVRVTPNTGNISPVGVGIFAFKNAGVTVTEAGIPAVPVSTAFRLYAEASGNFESGEIGSTQTGIAIANPGTSAVTVRFEVLTLGGTATGLTGTATIPANGQTATFLKQIQGLTALPVPFKGLLRITSDTNAQLSVVGLRGRYNERGDFLTTTTSPSDENAAASASALFFPHFATGQGYTTQFVVYSRSGTQTSTGFIRFTDQSGQAIPLRLN